MSSPEDCPHEEHERGAITSAPSSHATDGAGGKIGSLCLRLRHASRAEAVGKLEIGPVADYGALRGGGSPTSVLHVTMQLSEGF